jgi:hypothetical protein
MRFPFFGKAAPVRAEVDAPLQTNVFYLENGLGVMTIKWDDYIAVEEGLRHPIVYRALTKIAESVQQCRWFVEVDPYALPSERQGKERQIKDLQALLESPNPDLTAAQLRFWMGLNYASYGRVPVKIAMSAISPDRPSGIYPLEAKKVRAKINQRGTVAAYIYGEGEAQQEWPAKSEFNPASHKQGFVGQIWKPGLKGYQDREDINNPLKAIGLPAQVIRSLLTRAIKSAEGHPNVRYLVTCGKTITAPQLAALKKHLSEDSNTGGVNSGTVPILQNAADIAIHKLDNDLSDIHSKVPNDDMARLIFGAFGIPLAISGIGASDAAKFTGNFKDSRLSFWQDTLIPAYISPIFQGLTKMICPPGLRISPDLDAIPAFMDARIEAMKNISFVSFLTTDEKRELFGWAKTKELPASPFNTGAAEGATQTGTDANGAPNQQNQQDQQEAKP